MSPAASPSRSFTTRNPSRSQVITASGTNVRAARRSDDSSSASKVTRLGRPVRPSSVARRAASIGDSRRWPRRSAVRFSATSTSRPGSVQVSLTDADSASQRFVPAQSTLSTSNRSNAPSPKTAAAIAWFSRSGRSIPSASTMVRPVISSVVRSARSANPGLHQSTVVSGERTAMATPATLSVDQRPSGTAAAGSEENVLILRRSAGSASD